MQDVGVFLLVVRLVILYVNKRVYWEISHFFCKLYFVFVFAKILESSLLVWYNGLNDNRFFMEKICHIKTH